MRPSGAACSSRGLPLGGLEDTDMRHSRRLKSIVASSLDGARATSQETIWRAVKAHSSSAESAVGKVSNPSSEGDFEHRLGLLRPAWTRHYFFFQTDEVLKYGAVCVAATPRPSL